jgi:hypothetical protein
MYSPGVGLCVFSMTLGALIAIPFEKASIFSRARHHPPRRESLATGKRLTWTSHLVRRTSSMVLLPLAAIGFAVSCKGPPVPFIVPTLLAALIGFLSVLAIAECHGIIMEAYDTSDLLEISHRKRHSSRNTNRTNFSSFPRVTAAYANMHGLGFILAAYGTQ